MISTDLLNENSKKQALFNMKKYFEDLPIEIISVDNSSKILETIEWTEQVGMFFKRDVQRKETIASYKVNFIHNGNKKFIYLNEGIMRNKESLINSIKFDLGER